MNDCKQVIEMMTSREFDEVLAARATTMMALSSLGDDMVNCMAEEV